MSVCCQCCVLSGRGLCVGADHSSRGVLQKVMCLSTIAKGKHDPKSFRCTTGGGGVKSEFEHSHKHKTHTLHTRFLPAEI